MKYCFVLICFFLIGCQAMTWYSLQGLTKSEVQNHVGEPISIMREKNSEIWTYRQDQCTKHVFFDAAGTVKYVDVNGVCSK